MLYGKNENIDQGLPKAQDIAQPEDKSRSKQKPDIIKLIQRFWNGIQPETKRKILIACLVLSALTVALAGYKFSGRSFSGESAKKPAAENQKRDIDLDKNMVEKGLYEFTQSSLTNQDNKIEEIRASLNALEKNLPVVTPNAGAAPLDTSSSGSSCTSSCNPEPSLKRLNIPPPPVKQQVKDQSKRRSMYESPPPPPHVAEQGFMGGISFISNTELPKEQADKGKKKEEQKVYLPPSFMEATLLSGLAAPTTSAGKNSPLPILMRIKDLSILPNQVKANLKGCFLIAEGIGNLADERVQARLLTLSCLTKNGSSVIDQSIKGFVVDSDGKVGLKGMVTAKMGAMLARSALTGFLGGIGDALEQSSMTSSFSSATGTNQQWLTDTDAASIARTGVGKGVSNAMKDLQKFYLQLAEQTMPVIEVGATKTVTAVISEGVTLKIKENDSSPGV